MAWQSEYSWLTRRDPADAVQPAQHSGGGDGPGTPEHGPALRHLRQVVLPLFREIALAANASGYCGIAEMVVAPAPGHAEGAGPSHAMGASLRLARMRPEPGQEWAGLIQALYAGDTAFTLIRKTPEFEHTDYVPMAALNEIRLIEIAREVTRLALR